MFFSFLLRKQKINTYYLFWLLSYLMWTAVSAVRATSGFTVVFNKWVDTVTVRFSVHWKHQCNQSIYPNERQQYYYLICGLLLLVIIRELKEGNFHNKCFSNERSSSKCEVLK